MMQRFARNLLLAVLRCLHGFAAALLQRIEGDPEPAADGVPAHWRKLVEKKAPHLLGSRSAKLAPPVGGSAHPAPQWSDAPRELPIARVDDSNETAAPVLAARSAPPVTAVAAKRQAGSEHRIARPIRVIQIDPEGARLVKATVAAMTPRLPLPRSRTVDAAQTEPHAIIRPDVQAPRDMRVHPKGADAEPAQRPTSKWRFTSGVELSARVAWQNHPEWSHEIRPARFPAKKAAAHAVAPTVTEDTFPPLAPSPSRESSPAPSESAAARPEFEPSPWPELPEPGATHDFSAQDSEREQRHMTFLRRERRGQSWNA